MSEEARAAVIVKDTNHKQMQEEASKRRGKIYRLAYLEGLALNVFVVDIASFGWKT